MPNIETGTAIGRISFRRLAVGAWRAPRDPSIYVIWDLPADRVLPYLRDVSGHGVSVNIVHFFARVLAHGLRTYPDLNTALLRNTLRRREEVNLFFQTFVKGNAGYDLTGFTIENVDRMTLSELAATHRERTEAIRRGRNASNTSMRHLIARTPPALLAPAVGAADFLLNHLNLDLSRLGLPKDPFGSAMISANSAFGFDEAYPPLFPLARCAYSFSVSKIALRPVAGPAGVDARRICRINLTADHRYLDGVHVSKAMRLIRRMFAKPTDFRDVFE